MSEEIDILNPTIDMIRKSIRGIDDSYNNFWDILAELIQNSVDAINKKESKKGTIDIFIDSTLKKIVVKDDGIGIESALIPKLLSPFSTNKEGDCETIGEKGVGLKFVIYSTNNFMLRTRTKNDTTTQVVKILNGKSWKENSSIEKPTSTMEKETYKFEGTEVTVDGIDNEIVFNLRFKALIYLLRTKTAIGNVLNLFENNENIIVNFKQKDLNEEYHEEKIPFKYWLITENANNRQKIDLDDFITWCRERDRSDLEKTNMLKNKIIFKSGIENYRDYREIKYYACFVPTRKVWNNFSINDGLIDEEALNDDELMQSRIYTIYQPGIYTSVKGMPTGIVIEPPSTGNAGYWSNMFIMFEDRLLKFDIGRKSINGNIKSIYKEIAKKIFSEFTGYVVKYACGAPDVVTTNPAWDRDNIKQQIDGMAKLNCEDIVNFRNIPLDQEASVAAIFYELIGQDYISNLAPVITGYRNKYDLYAYWNNHFIVVEFKSRLKNIIRDFDDYIKMSNEIDYIVCWDVTDDDVVAFNDASMILEDFVQDQIMGIREECMDEVTHKLLVSYTAKPIYIIDLKKLISKIKEAN